MNNKGFTLVELIATIAILAILMVIAVPSINNASTLIKKSQKKNIIKNLEIAGARYAFDTGDTLFFVEDLIMFGYMDSDDDISNVVIDPVTNESLNCYAIKAEKEGDHYNATFKNKEYITDNKCDRNLLIDDNVEITLTAQLNGKTLSNGNWIRTSDICSNCKITLKAGVECNSNNKCMWSSTNGTYLIGGNLIEYDLGNVNVMNLQFSFQVVNDAKVIKQNFGIRVDNEEPTININDSRANINNTTFTIYATDGLGSGIAGYYLARSDCYNGSNFENNNILPLNGSGKYYVCVKDNVGNIAHADFTI